MNGGGQNIVVHQITRRLSIKEVDEMLARFERMQEPYIQKAEELYVGEAAKEAKISAAIGNAVILTKELLAKYR